MPLKYEPFPYHPEWTLNLNYFESKFNVLEKKNLHEYKNKGCK